MAHQDCLCRSHEVVSCCVVMAGFGLSLHREVICLIFCVKAAIDQYIFPLSGGSAALNADSAAVNNAALSADRAAVNTDSNRLSTMAFDCKEPGAVFVWAILWVAKKFLTCFALS